MNASFLVENVFPVLDDLGFTAVIIYKLLILKSFCLKIPQNLLLYRNSYSIERKPKLLNWKNACNNTLYYIKTAKK